MFTIKQVKALLDLGFTHEQIAQMGGGAAPAASQPVAEAAPPKVENDFLVNVIRKRVGCAYGVKSCGSFAPNGVGSKQHTTCPKGRKALAAARKSR